uniref:Orcokinin n=1 Tax=Anopheles melas TaxID=34690 RepID=A0A182TWY3_9DIPT
MQVNEEKLQQLGGASTNGQRTAEGASSGAAGGIAGAASSGFKTKRSLNNSDRRTLLYNYYSRGLAPMYDKRNFDEIDRFARFNGKRNLDYEPSYTGSADHGYNGRFSKRNFDEIDRFNGMSGFNYRLNGDDMATIGKRNFDEIDRFGRFAFNKRYFPEVNELSPGNNLKHDLSEDMAVINEYSQSSSSPAAPAACVDEALECGEAKGSGEGAGDLTRCTETAAGDGRLFRAAAPPTTLLGGGGGSTPLLAASAAMSCCVLVLSSGRDPPVDAGDCPPPAAALIAFIIIIDAIEATAGVLPATASPLLPLPPPIPSWDEWE